MVQRDKDIKEIKMSSDALFYLLYACSRGFFDGDRKRLKKIVNDLMEKGIIHIGLDDGRVYALTVLGVV